MRQMNISFSREPDYFAQSELDRLRVSMGFAGTNRAVFMITSSEPAEGKSFIAVNLWRDLARGGKRVCFVDADMRKSNLRVDYKLSPAEGEFLGLSHFLSGQAQLQDVIYQTDEKNAYIIPTVTSVNPSLLLEGDLFRNMLNALKERFDYLIVDTPPLGIVSDGQKIAGIADGVILVVRAHETKREMVKSSIARLESIGAPFLGVVLNRVDEERTKSYYSKSYYSKQYYTKGYTNSGEKTKKSSSSKKSSASKKSGQSKADLGGKSEMIRPSETGADDEQEI